MWMKLILEYQGTVALSGNNVAVAGYLISEDPVKLGENLAQLVETFTLDSSQANVPVDNPAVMLSIELGPLSPPPSTSGNNGSGGPSAPPTTTPSVTHTPPVGTGSQPRPGPTAASVPRAR
jgi:hypothetical protein